MCGSLVFSASAEVSDPNVIVDGSFENGGIGWDGAFVDSGVASDGFSSYHVRIPGDFKICSQTVSVEKDTYYLVSADVFWVETLGGESSVSIEINNCVANLTDWYQVLVNPGLDPSTPVGEWITQSRLWYSGSAIEVEIKLVVQNADAYVDNVKMIKQTVANGSFQNLGDDDAWFLNNDAGDNMGFEYSNGKVYSEIILPEDLNATAWPLSYSLKAVGNTGYAVQYFNVKPNTYYYLSAAMYRTDANKNLAVVIGNIDRPDIYVLSQSTGAWETQSLVWYSGNCSGTATVMLQAENVGAAAGEYYIDNVLLYEYVPQGVYTDKVFSGWYADAEGTTPFVPGAGSERVYPKWTDKNALSVKVQLTNGTTAESASTSMRLVSTVDSLEYEEVGFMIQVGDGAVKKYSTTTVYNRISGADQSYTPSVFSQDSKHFFAFNIRNIPQASFTTHIVATPYWKTLDGTVVYGATRILNVLDLI